MVLHAQVCGRVGRRPIILLPFNPTKEPIGLFFVV
jgi:hypothetical protein